MALFWFSPNVEKLRQRGDAKGLIKALRYKKVRIEAGKALLTLGEQALDPLLNHLKEAILCSFERRTLMKAITMIGTHAVEPLLHLFSSGDKKSREIAMEALVNIGDQRAIEPFMHAAQQGDSLWRGQTLEALAKISGNQCFQMLIDALNDEEYYIQLYAAKAIGYLYNPAGVKPLSVLMNEVLAWNINKEDLAGITKINQQNPDREAVESLIKIYHQGEMLNTIYGSLAMLGDTNAMDQLLKWMNDEKSIYNRRTACIALGRVGGSKAVDRLIEALNDPDREVREIAIWELAETDDSRAIQQLEDRLSKADKTEIESINSALFYARTFPTVSPATYFLQTRSYLTLFIFDSDFISAKISSNYGGFCESDVLQALFAATSSSGGWSTLGNDLKGCHGDLLERSFLGEIPSVQVLGSWLETGENNINVNYLDSSMVSKLRSHEKLGFIPFTVGLSKLSTEIMGAAHEYLISRNEAYKGLITLDGDYDISFLDSKLALPLHLFIRGKRCKGWAVTRELLNEVGLEME